MSAGDTSPTAIYPNGRILIVAGSDSGGGAGLQADIKTVTALGGFAMTAVTALTVQNTHGVKDIMDVPPHFVAAQMMAVLSDLGADAVKTGMLARTEVIEAVAPLLDDFPNTAVIDPVMVASSGDRLLTAQAVSAMQSLMLPQAALVTPNMPEAEILTNRGVEKLDDMKHAADRLMTDGAQAALIKGGHGNEAVVTDLLAEQSGFTVFENPRFDSKNTHGTGCTLASSIATGLGQGLALVAAVERGLGYVRRAIETANSSLGTGHNKPLNHAHPMLENLQDP
ncbi:MAG: bifunctional hydroxymethylpyrimidine kinase/phosphomethylpyrimidine kinase [Pseudomonadota bacterium]|nr:bifunctional hydroxymethylpyrimidine kinase/phosphomethylpyrimidine kinase [Pseudomonadota bacterium]